MSVGGKPGKYKETRAQQAQAETGARWAEMSREVLGPVKAHFRDRVLDTASMERTATDRAAVDVEQQFARAGEAVAGSQMRAGNRPGGTNFARAVGGLARDAGASRGLVLADAKAAVQDQGVVNRQAVVDMALGDAAQGAAGLNRAAQVSTEQAIADATAAAGRRAAVAGLAGTAAGIAAGSAMGGKAAMPSGPESVRSPGGSFDFSPTLVDQPALASPGGTTTLNLRAGARSSLADAYALAPFDPRRP